LTSETKTLLDQKAKHLIAQPDYDLMVLGRKSSQELFTERVIHFNRTDLIPYQVDIYDQNGAIQTEATYGPMETFGEISFPKTIAIKRPFDELQILLTFEKLSVNLPLPSDKFELTIPANTTIHKLD
jgi:outer membrane lipoprotein-sorting protein